jgi:ABC-2 type transport system ATP-binding protein
MRLLCGGLQPTSGKIRVAGYDIPKEVEHAREHIGYLAQRFSLYGDLTITENLEFFGEVFDMPEKEMKARAKDLLRFAGLEKFANRQASALSGGMQKKLGLATALIHSPEVLLLDEPTGAVDPVARQEFWYLLIGLLRGGSAVLVSTPYMDEAMRFNRVIFMEKGKVLVEGTPHELLHRLDNRVLELAAEPQMQARWIVEKDPDVQDVQAFGDRLHLRVREMAGPLARLPGLIAAGGVSLIHLKPVSPVLEDVFMELLEK